MGVNEAEKRKPKSEDRVLATVSWMFRERGSAEQQEDV